ncbi:hypothetical protein ACFPM0_12200 [Pseudonocardia sulfidoxydans]|uniref:hypothetical protein n=1 Tax=Pseudonocardia sulfidoxydans TaxID=54011 RepID=UPI003611E31B
MIADSGASASCASFIHREQRSGQRAGRADRGDVVALMTVRGGSERLHQYGRTSAVRPGGPCRGAGCAR